MTILATVDLPGHGQSLRHHKAQAWFQIGDDDRYILCRGFTYVCYFGPAGAESFVHDLKQFVGAKEKMS